jgi:methyl-accepting chemotaxis protein
MGLLTFSAVMGILLLATIFLLSERTLMMEERQNGVRQTVEVAHGLLVHYHGMAANGKITEEQAKQSAIAEIRTLRYSGNEYFWINDMHPIEVMHPIKPELEGKDLSDLKDARGTYLYKEFVTVVKASGGGFVPYLWPKPGSEKAVEKMAYVKGFAPWGWIIGSGV